MNGDFRRVLEQADGAFIGTFLDRDEAKPDENGTTSSATLVEYRFRLDEAVKGQFESVVEVMSANNGATCGLEVPRGEQAGLFLRRGGDGRWQGSLCETTDPATMRDVVKPLPAPDGRGPPMLVVGGSFGENRVIALDDRGRPLSYGPGRRETAAMAVCPGSTRLVEAVNGEQGEPDLVAVRRLPDLGVVAEQRVPTTELEVLGATACVGQDASDAVVWSHDWGSTAGIGRVRRVTAGGVREVWSGPAQEGTFSHDGRTAFLVTPGEADVNAVAVDLSTGKARSLADVPARTGRLVPNSTATKLAAVVAPPGGDTPAQVLLIDLTAHQPTLRTVDLGTSSNGYVLWMGDRIVYLPGGVDTDAVRVFDTGLRQRATWVGWKSENGVVVGSTVYGYSYYGGLELQSAPVLTGPAKTLRTIRGVRPIAIVGVPPVVAPAPAPATTAVPPTPEITTTVATTSTTSTTMPEAVVAASAASSGRDAGGGLLALGLAMWLGAAAGSVLVRRRWSRAVP
ncbi:MAG: hypothetical protein QOG87_1005 [Actinomycetota bacterium]|jgi:hypothetical protein